MMVKYLKFHSILKVPRSLLQELIKHREYGQLMLAKNYKFWKDILMKYLVVHSIMKEIQ